MSTPNDGRKRVARTRKKVEYTFSDSEVSDDGAKQRKRPRKHSDDSFHLDTEETNTGTTSKKTVRKKAATNVSRKRRAKDEVRDGMEGSSAKKVKTEPILSFDSAAVKQERFSTEGFHPNVSREVKVKTDPELGSYYNPIPYIKKDTQDTRADYKPFGSSHVSPGSNAQHDNWRCVSCGANNYHWRVSCYKCWMRRPDRDQHESGYKDHHQSSGFRDHHQSSGFRDHHQSSGFRDHHQSSSFRDHHQSSGARDHHQTSGFRERHHSSGSRDHHHHQSIGARDHQHKKSDWSCPNCSSNNFPWRRDCFRCHSLPPPAETSRSNNTQQNIKSENEWLCNCGMTNFIWRKECAYCHNNKSESFNVGSKEIKKESNKEDNVKKEIKKESNIEDNVKKEIKKESNKEDNFKKVIKKESNKEDNVKKESQIIEEIKPSTSFHSKNNAEIKLEIKSDIQLPSNNHCDSLPLEEKDDKPEKSVGKSSASKKLPNKKVKDEKSEEPEKEKKPKINTLSDDEFIKECQLLTRKTDIPFNIVKSVINLLNSDATIPFIVRYRSHMIGGLSAQEIRMLKQRYESVKKLMEKANKLKKKLESLGYLDAALSCAIDSCQTQQELDYLYEPFKVLKSSKLVKVIDLGLSVPAENILYGRGIINLQQFTKPDLELNEITDLMIYYAGEIMSKDSELMDNVRELIKTQRIYLKTKQKPIAKSKKELMKSQRNRPEDVYSNYYNFSCPYDRVKPHQILAINRAESEQVLQVVLDIPESFQFKLNHFAKKKWYYRGAKYENRDQIFNKALDFMYSKRVCPYLKRFIRNELTKQGEKASLEVFSSNLKYLLLTPPIRNVTVCAVDPGFKNGCKIAVLSPQQEILRTDVLYLEKGEHFGYKDCLFAAILNSCGVDLLVVGNGKGCREVELKISQLLEKNAIKRTMKYVVLSESGLSVYSCSPEAVEEYPGISPNLVSAISLAKRAQDPLCELVKVEPKHLGVGMYQHDINAKKLDSVLDDVVSECVSLVGVDVNNAPLRILKRVAGLTESRAKALIETREKKGPFQNREELMDVKGIGPKTFQQCAGFIKIIPGTCTKTEEKGKSDFNHLDQTIIHPEDYPSAQKILGMNKLKAQQIGSFECINKLKNFMASENLPSLATKLHIPFETLKLILEALTCPLDYDIRATFDKPIFRNKAASMDSLVINSEVCGRIENVTHFGAFVDIGVETSGLIPSHSFNGNDLHLGQIVRVKIGDIDTVKMRISLSLVRIENTVH